MQKLLRRTAQAKTQAARRRATELSKNRTTRRKLRNHEEMIINRSIAGDIKAARIAQREDWFLGPLAPRRDVGTAKETYGTIGMMRLNPAKKERWKNWHIEEGDRVCVIEKGHREVGKIGTVREVRGPQEVCVVEGINLVDIVTPRSFRDENTDDRPFRTIEAPIHLSSVRLVYPLPSPTGGPPRDVIVESITLDTVSQRRLVTGHNPSIVILRPKRPEADVEDYDIDCLRIDVEKRTWVPTLLKLPMPGGVIDELRNKYGVHRTRHEEGYLERRKQLDEREERKKERMARGIVGMMTPLQELHVRDRGGRVRRGVRGAEMDIEEEHKEEVEVSEEVLRRIGEVMARNGVELGEEGTEA